MLAGLLNKAKNITNPSLNQLEAVVAGCLIIALGDGKMDAAEEDQIRRGVTNSEALKPLIGQLDTILDRYEQALSQSPRKGMRDLRKQLEDVAGNPETAMDVLTLVIDVADKGGIDPTHELPRLATVAQCLGISPATVKREFEIDLPAAA